MPLLSLSRLPDEARANVAAALNRALACTYSLHLAIKSAHWNTKGPLFISLHKLYDELAGGMLARADELAERVTSLGVSARATAAIVGAAPCADFTAEFIDCHDSVRRVLAAYVPCHDLLRTAREVANQVGDRESAQLLDVMLTDMEHDAGLLRPHIEEIAAPAPTA